MIKLGFLSLKKGWGRVLESVSVLGSGNVQCFLMQEPEQQRRCALCEVFQLWEESFAPRLG